MIKLIKDIAVELILKGKKQQLTTTVYYFFYRLTILFNQDVVNENILYMLPYLAALADQQVRQWPRLLRPPRSSPNPHAEPAFVPLHGPATHPTRARTCTSFDGHWRGACSVPCVCVVLLAVAVLLGEQRLRCTAFFGGPGVKSFYSLWQG